MPGVMVRAMAFARDPAPTDVRPGPLSRSSSARHGEQLETASPLAESSASNSLFSSAMILWQPP